MNIELKNIKVSETLSEETTAFTATLYVDGKRVGSCDNHGQGGPTDYRADGADNEVVLEKAEKYCEGLPPIDLGEGLGTIPSNLEHIIDDLLTKHLEEKDRQKWQKKMEREMKKGILVGNETSYRVFKSKADLETILTKVPDPVKWLNDALANIAPKMEVGDRILNTNFPAGVTIPQPITA